ncbi:MAG: glycine cleavage system aminomethyltransferase GcvT, partial [Promethearchaeota archaeon]
MEPRKTPLYPVHEKLGARFVDFEGWIMPVQYRSVIDEHLNTRKNVSLFDISHMGELMVTGENAFDLMQYVCTNDVSLMSPGFAQYSPMCFENGNVVDDIFYYFYSRSKFRLFVNASNKEKDINWLKRHSGKFKRVLIDDISDNRARIALQGPRSEDVLQKLIKDDLSKISRFHFIESSIDSVDIFLARTGYTGEDGFEMSFPASESEHIWNALMDAGQEFNIMPAGLGARDTLRLEACYSLYGHELSESITPIEAGVEFVVKPSKKADYIGRDVLEKQLTT